MQSDGQSQRRIRSGLFLGLVLVCSVGRADEIVTDFAHGFGPWVPLHTGTWSIEDEDGDSVAALTEAGTQRPPVRRPAAYLFLPDHVWQDLEFTIRAKSLEPDEIANRDVVLIFGYIDDTHYYYAHISSSADDKLHNIIMKVTGDEREVIHRETLPQPRLTNDSWHTIRVLHSRTGRIDVHVDDLEDPLMTADDTDYPVGSVAFGSFNDRALFTEVSLSGNLAEIEPLEPIFSGGHHSPFSVGFFGTAGFHYRIEESNDLRTWTPVGETRIGQDQEISELVDVSADTADYIRVSGDHPTLAEE